jgi:negative regulator of sigma E activity
VGGDADLPRPSRRRCGVQRYYADAAMRGEPVRVAVARLPTAAGDLQFVVAETRVKRERTTREYVSNVLLMNLAVLAAVVLAVIVGVDRGLAPVTRLTRELECALRARPARAGRVGPRLASCARSSTSSTRCSRGCSPRRPAAAASWPTPRTS